MSVLWSVQATGSRHGGATLQVAPGCLSNHFRAHQPGNQFLPAPIDSVSEPPRLHQTQTETETRKKWRRGEVTWWMAPDESRTEAREVWKKTNKKEAYKSNPCLLFVCCCFVVWQHFILKAVLNLSALIHTEATNSPPPLKKSLHWLHRRALWNKSNIFGTCCEPFLKTE